MHHVIGGGTFSHVRNHLSLAAPAFGKTARFLHQCLTLKGAPSTLHLTKMACSDSNIVTTHDVTELVEKLKFDQSTGIVFFNPAIVDFDGQIGDVVSGKYAERIQSRKVDNLNINLTPAGKIIGSIREHRKDIFVVGFKTTCGVNPDLQYALALRLVKEGHVNLVLANDTQTRMNMIVVPEEARYCETTDRTTVLQKLVDIALSRHGLTFTRSTVLRDRPRVNWNSDEVPTNLREVVNHLIQRGAYKPFLGRTAGHFAARGQSPDEFLTSARQENFNDLPDRGLIRVFAKSRDEVIAHAAKPSVGGQSQRIIFSQFPELDAIVHFHAPLKQGVDRIPVRPQWMYECGSHQCGENTAAGLKEIRPGIYAVMLDNHGPNIVFSRTANPKHVVEFIEKYWDLDGKTGGRIHPTLQMAIQPG